MLDDLAGKRTGERIQILRKRRGLSRPVLAGLVGMSASWLKGIERETRLPPRLPLLVKLAEALVVGDVAVLACTDMDLGGAASVPVASFARIPHDAVPAIREAVRDPLLVVPAGPADVAALAARTADAWHVWHQSTQHRTDVGRILPRLVTDARVAARTAEGSDRRAASAVLADVYALVQHEVVWASEAELTWTAAGRAMSAAQDADTPAALAGAAWMLSMVQRSAGDTDGALTLAAEAAGPLEPRLEDAGDELRGVYGALQLHAAATAARAGREGDAWRHWDAARATAGRLPGGYYHPWTMFGAANASSCTPCRSPLTCPGRPRPATTPRTSTPSRSRAGSGGAGWAWRSPAPTISAAATRPRCTGWSRPTRPQPIRCATPRPPGR